MSNRILILGGAGFIGSHIAERFAQSGWQTTVVDGLLPGTGGSLANLAHLGTAVTRIFLPVEAVTDLVPRLDAADLVVDAMAWTSHLLAMRDPLRDLQLNAQSHLTALIALPRTRCRRVIYLGSRGQYGNPSVDPVLESTPMEPVDIQGVHKLAAESYYRILGAKHGIDVISLRLPNCFGERQPFQGEDPGLIGGFLRDALANKVIEIYGSDRRRCVLYAGDAADIVFKLAHTTLSGFTPFNSGGHEVPIAHLAHTIARLVGRGRCEVMPLPPQVKAIDAGSARFDASRLAAAIGPVPLTALENSLARTLHWIQTNPHAAGSNLAL